MKKMCFLFFLVIYFLNLSASDHGIYLHAVSNIQGNMDDSIKRAFFGVEEE